MNKLFKPLLVLLLLPFVVACTSTTEEEPMQPFHLASDYGEVMLGENYFQDVANGSGRLKVSYPDTVKSYAKVEYYKETDEWHNLGYLKIHALKIGEIGLTLTDSVTNEVQKLKIKIRPTYVCLEVSESKDPVWFKGMGVVGLFLVQNAERSFYLCQYSPIRRRFVSKAVSSGTYTIVEENGVPTAIRLESKDKNFERYFILTKENKQATLDALDKLRKQEIGPNDDKIELPLILEERDMKTRVMAGFYYKQQGLNLPNKLMD